MSYNNMEVRNGLPLQTNDLKPDCPVGTFIKLNELSDLLGLSKDSIFHLLIDGRLTLWASHLGKGWDIYGKNNEGKANYSQSYSNHHRYILLEGHKKRNFRLMNGEKVDLQHEFCKRPAAGKISTFNNQKIITYKLDDVVFWDPNPLHLQEEFQTISQDNIGTFIEDLSDYLRFYVHKTQEDLGAKGNQNVKAKSIINRPQRLNSQTEIIFIYFEKYKKDKTSHPTESRQLFGYMREKARSGVDNLSITGMGPQEIVIDGKVLDSDAFAKRFKRWFSK